MSDIFELFQNRAFDAAAMQLSHSTEAAQQLRPALLKAMEAITELQIETANESVAAALRMLPSALEKLAEWLALPENESGAEDVVELPEEVLPAIEIARPYMTEEHQAECDDILTEGKRAGFPKSVKEKLWTFLISFLASFLASYIVSLFPSPQLQEISELITTIVVQSAENIEQNDRDYELNLHEIELLEKVVDLLQDRENGAIDGTMQLDVSGKDILPVDDDLDDIEDFIDTPTKPPADDNQQEDSELLNP